MLQKIFPEDSPDISSESVCMQDEAPAHTSKMAMEWLKDRFPRETDLAADRIHLGPTFTRSEPYIFVSSVIWKRKSEKKSRYNYSNEGESQGDGLSQNEKNYAHSFFGKHF